MLIVNDITAGALPHKAVLLGAEVDVVHEDQLAMCAGQWAEGRMRKAALAAASSAAAAGSAATAAAPSSASRGRKRRPTGSEATASAPEASAATPPPGTCTWHVGRVATGGAESRKTRGAFVPDEDYTPCFDAIVFGSALLDAARKDEHRQQQMEELTKLWKRPDGVRLPERVELKARDHEFDRPNFYHASLPDPRLRLAGVEGALRALGEPCALSEGGAAYSTNDDGLVFHGLHAILPAPTAPASAVLHPRPNVNAPKATRPARASGKGGPPPAAATAAAAAASTSAALAPPTSAEDEAGATVVAGVLECFATLPSGELIAGGLEAFDAMRQKEEKYQRSAVARATYLGVQLHLKREERKPKAPKTAATE